MMLLKLFASFAKIGLFSVGGAYSFLPMIESEAVEKYHWITPQEFLDVSGLATIIPGAISAKFASYVGYKIGGILGVVFANLGLLVTPVFLMLMLMFFLERYKEYDVLKFVLAALQFAVIGMILAIGVQYLLEIFSQQTKYSTLRYGIFVLVFALVAMLWGRVTPVLVITATLLVSVLAYVLQSAI